MLTPERTKRFRKNFKLCMKRGYDVSAFEEVYDLLIEEKPLPERCRNHKLHGKFADYWECHVKSDWLLIYRYDYKRQVITFEDTGTHSDLFK